MSYVQVYVEYSNEVWNGIFRQTRYTQEQGGTPFPDDPTYRQGLKYFNNRATETAILWDMVGDKIKKFMELLMLIWKTLVLNPKKYPKKK